MSFQSQSLYVKNHLYLSKTNFSLLFRIILIPFLKSWVRLRGPVIQANGRLTFEDDLRSGGLLCFISMNASVRTELADSMVTPGEPGGD